MSRFYPKEFPNIGEMVCVKIKEKEENGFTCSLLEYGEIDSYLAMSELSKKRIRSVNNHARLGQVTYFQVLRVAKGYVDVSKKNITTADKNMADDKYQKGKNMYSIFNQLADVMKQPQEEIQKRLAWPLYKDYTYVKSEEEENSSNSDDTSGDDDDDEEEVIIFKKVISDHPYNLLRKFILEDVPLEIDITEEEKVALKKILVQRINSVRLTVRAKVELTCFTYEGIESIKKAATIMKKIVPEVSINYASAPEYFISIICSEAEEGSKSVRKGLRVLTDAIEELGGHCDFKGSIEII